MLSSRPTVASMMRLSCVADVSRSGFYQWLRNPRSDRALKDQRLLGLIRAAYTGRATASTVPRGFFSICEKRARPVVNIVLLGLCGPITSKPSTGIELPDTPEVPRVACG